MSNQVLLNCIESACKSFEHRKISIAELQLAIESNGEALERVSSEEFSKLHDFCNALERLEFGCLVDNQYSEGCKVIVELRIFLKELSRRQG